jgi:hypothetical protein
MKKGITLLLISLSFTAFSNPYPTETSESQIRQVVELFRISLLNKDKETFGSLFYSEDIPFIAVFSEDMLKQKRAENPNYPSNVNFGKFGPPTNMISDDEDIEEKIWNLQIQTNQHLASVHFDYSNHVNGKKRAWGTESWSLIKVDESWKITSVSFTVTEEKKP